MACVEIEYEAAYHSPGDSSARDVGNGSIEHVDYDCTVDGTNRSDYYWDDQADQSYSNRKNAIGEGEYQYARPKISAEDGSPSDRVALRSRHRKSAKTKSSKSSGRGNRAVAVPRTHKGKPYAPEPDSMVRTFKEILSNDKWMEVADRRQNETIYEEYIVARATDQEANDQYNTAYDYGEPRTATEQSANGQPSLESFSPKELCTALNGNTLSAKFDRGTYAPGGNLQWLPAQDISAAVLAHHLNYHRIEEDRATRSCKRIGCKRKAKHLNYGKAALVLYIHGDEKGFLIDVSKGFLSPAHILDLKTQSQQYATRHGVLLKDIILAEFITAQWIKGDVSKYTFPSGPEFWSEERPVSYAGATVCSNCWYWTPYGVKCLNTLCKESLPSVDEIHSTDGSIGAGAMAAYIARVGTEGLHPDEDVGFALGGALGGAAFTAIIFMFWIGGAVGGG
ncbi:hypothetical protein BDZ45DRAFT_760632 [Acephala macrosclerotiorum]|nr:hypothetical protein BDZ45DRAFT_760632 [Acephala macrosclerotiorum]